MDGTAVLEIVNLVKGWSPYTTIDGKHFRSKDMSPLKMEVEEDLAQTLYACNLSSIVNYANEHIKGKDAYKLFINIEAYNKVRLFSELNRDSKRNEYVSIEFRNEVFNFGQFVASEPFVIKVMSQFEDSGDRAKVLVYAGNAGHKVNETYKDDGVRQEMTVKTGVVNEEVKEIPNPVQLAPFRTFTEIAQPQSSYIFRAQQSRSGQGIEFALFEADGGNWKVTAVKRIREYFATELEKHIKAGKVIVL